MVEYDGTGIYLFNTFVKGTFSKRGAHFNVSSYENPIWVHRDYLIAESINTSWDLWNVYASILSLTDSPSGYELEEETLPGDKGKTLILCSEYESALLKLARSRV